MGVIFPDSPKYLTDDDDLPAPSTRVLSAPRSSGLVVRTLVVRCMAIANVDISGTSTVTALDGVVLQPGDAILVPFQTSPAENGIYIVQDMAPLRVVRAPETNSAAELWGCAVRVSAGTRYHDTLWYQAGDLSPSSGAVIGTTPIRFRQGLVTAQESARGSSGEIYEVLSPAADPAGAADFVTMIPAGRLDFSFRVVDALIYTITGVSLASATLRMTDSSGTALSNAIATTTAGVTRMALAGDPPLVPAGTAIGFARSTNATQIRGVVTIVRAAS